MADTGSESGRCGRCGETIPADVERCPLCGYQPGPWNRRLARFAEYACIAAVVASVLILAGGVTASVLDLPVGDLTRIAIVTPYTGGITGFFAYYLHRKRQATPTDEETFG